MQCALVEAKKAFDEDEVPIGAVIVANDRLVASCHNQVEHLNDATAHAEILALTSAMDYFGAKYLPHCTLYVTVEPCVMCMGAIRWAQISRVVFAATDEKAGYRQLSPKAVHPSCQVLQGVLEAPCRELMKRFFKQKR